MAVFYSRTEAYVPSDFPDVNRLIKQHSTKRPESSWISINIIITLLCNTPKTISLQSYVYDIYTYVDTIIRLITKGTAL